MKLYTKITTLIIALCILLCACSGAAGVEETGTTQETSATTSTTAPTAEATTTTMTTTATTTTTTTTTTKRSGLPLPKQEVEEYERTAFKLINQERTSRGIPALKWNDDLHNLACIRAEEASRRWAHTRPDGREWSTVFDDYGFGDYYGYNATEGDGYRYYTAENLASNNKDVYDATNMLMDSKSHRASILATQHLEVGVGIYRADDGYVYMSQIFRGKVIE
ncbi:MAG: hypothetical protein IJR60_08700 [Eubacterium sp.]|nr:hypothetical protein [Eubacterium sp.]